MQKVAWTSVVNVGLDFAAIELGSIEEFSSRRCQGSGARGVSCQVSGVKQVSLKRKRMHLASLRCGPGSSPVSFGAPRPVHTKV